MFTNPGKSLKTFATIIFWLIIVLSTLSVAIMTVKGGYIVVMLSLIPTLIVSALVGYSISIFIFAFGELVENSTSIRKHLERIEYLNDQH